MPEYEFRCSVGHTFTVTLPMRQSGEATCPNHGILSTQKIISIPNIGGHHTQSAVAEEAQAMIKKVEGVDIKSQASDVLKQLEKTQEIVRGYQNSRE